MSDGGGGGTLVSRFKGSTYVGAPTALDWVGLSWDSLLNIQVTCRSTGCRITHIHIGWGV